MDKLFENENAYSETTLLKVRRVSFTTLALPNSHVSKFELNWTSPLPPSLWVPFKDTLRNFPLPLSSVIERKYPTLVSTLQSLPCLPYMRALTFPPALPVQFTTLPRHPNLSTSSIIFRTIRTSILVKTWLRYLYLAILVKRPLIHYFTIILALARTYVVNLSLRTVPPFVTANTFMASRDIRFFF